MSIEHPHNNHNDIPQLLACTLLICLFRQNIFLKKNYPCTIFLCRQLIYTHIPRNIPGQIWFNPRTSVCVFNILCCFWLVGVACCQTHSKLLWPDIEYVYKISGKIKSSTNRLKQLGAQAREKSEKVINQNTFLVSYSAEIVGKGNSHQPKPCKCGFLSGRKDHMILPIFKKCWKQYSFSFVWKILKFFFIVLEKYCFWTIFSLNIFLCYQIFFWLY